MKKILFIAVSLCLFVSCEKGNGVKELKQLQFSSEEQELVNHCNDFSFNLLAQVANGEQKENVILSPLSASMLLGMLMNGADTQTLMQIQNVTGFDDKASMDEINAWYRQLIDVLPALDHYTNLNIANGIWAREDFPFKETFMEACKQNFDAQTKNVPTFLDSKVLDDINRFAAQQTNNRIKKVIDEQMVNSETVMILLNALYFKTMWLDKFKKENTKPHPFTTLNGEQIQADMMRQTHDWCYGESDDYQFLQLPYKGGKYCANIILPAKGIDIREWIKTLNAERWQQILYKTFYPEVSLELPKFSLSYDRMLTDDLKALGMKDAFNPLVADFSRLSEFPSYVSFIKQYTFMQVDEEGTEAAAVTIGGMYAESAMPEEPREFIVDRPFLFVIRECTYGTILFTAIIGHPEWQK